MLKLKLNESTNLAFDMVVEGSRSTVERTWLVFESEDGFEVRIPAEHRDNQVFCRIPCLEGILPNGPTTVHLEVVVDGRFYRPVTETVQLGKGQDFGIISQEAAPKPRRQEAAQPSTFESSLNALDKLRNGTRLTNEEQAMISLFGTKFEEKFAQERKAHKRKVAEARKIAEALVGGLNTNDGMSVSELKALIHPKKQ